MNEHRVLSRTSPAAVGWARCCGLAVAAVVLASCSGGQHALTPAQRLHAAVTAAQGVFDPTSAGGAGYGTDASRVAKMGHGAYGVPLPWPDDAAFRPLTVYVGVPAAGGTVAGLWVLDRSGRAWTAMLDGAHRVSYEVRPASEQRAAGLIVLHRGVVSADQIRAAFRSAGFGEVSIQAGSGGHLEDGLRPLVVGGTPPGPAARGHVTFTLFRTAAAARQLEADALWKEAAPRLGRNHLGAVVGSAALDYYWGPPTGAPPADAADHSPNFLAAVAHLRRILHGK